LPKLCIYRDKDECLMDEYIEDFSTVFNEVHYRMATIYDKNDGPCFVYNPETIVQVAKVSDSERIEFLVTEKRFEEAMIILNQKKYQIDD
jgi:hypothetical protein